MGPLISAASLVGRLPVLAGSKVRQQDWNGPRQTLKILCFLKALE